MAKTLLRRRPILCTNLTQKSLLRETEIVCGHFTSNPQLDARLLGIKIFEE